MGHHIFPLEFVFWTKNPKHEIHKQQLLPKIKEGLGETHGKQVDKWLCDVNTEFFNNNAGFEKYLPFIMDAAYPALDQMFAEIPNITTPSSSKITEIWYNHYGLSGGSGQEVHSHGCAGYSGIYLLELTEPNTTIFYSYLAGLSNVAASATFKTEFASEGDILLFPSSMLHYVVPTKNARTTVAFNVNCTGCGDPAPK